MIGRVLVFRFGFNGDAVRMAGRGSTAFVPMARTLGRRSREHHAACTHAHAGLSQDESYSYLSSGPSCGKKKGRRKQTVSKRSGDGIRVCQGLWTAVIRTEDAPPTVVMLQLCKKRPGKEAYQTMSAWRLFHQKSFPSCRPTRIISPQCRYLVQSRLENEQAPESRLRLV